MVQAGKASAKRSKPSYFMAILGVSIVLFFVGISLLTAKQVWHSYQLWLVPAALVFIVAAHLKNYRLSRVYRTVRVRDHEG